MSPPTEPPPAGWSLLAEIPLSAPDGAAGLAAAPALAAACPRGLPPATLDRLAAAVGQAAASPASPRLIRLYLATAPPADPALGWGFFVVEKPGAGAGARRVEVYLYRDAA